MSPETALHSGVFLIYFWLVIGLLTVAGGVLAGLRWGWRKNVDAAWAAYTGWLFMAPLALACVFAGRGPFIAFVCLLSALAFKEYARATGLYRDWVMMAVVYAGIFAQGVTAYVQHPHQFERGSGWYGLFIVLPVYVIALILFVPIARNRVQGQLQTLALASLGYLYIGWMFCHLAFLANATHAYGFLLYVMLATSVNDVAAFTCGKLFGRHPLRSRISPKKTWEGALGALAVSFALPWLMRFSFPPEFGPRELLLTGLIVGLGGQLGDLSISVIKRDLGVKDMGANIPGHGGVLDRVDSLIYVAPLFFHMAGFFHPLR